MHFRWPLKQWLKLFYINTTTLIFDNITKNIQFYDKCNVHLRYTVTFSSLHSFLLIYIYFFFLSDFTFWERGPSQGDHCRQNVWKSLIRQYFLRLAAGLERGLNPIGCRVVKELCEEFEISCDQDWKRGEFKEERRSKGPGNDYSYGQFDHMI